MLVHIRHSKIDDISALVAAMPALARYEQTGDVQSQLDAVRALVENLWDSETPSWLEIIAGPST